MLDPTFRQKLLAGELLLGTMVAIGTPAVAEILAGSGFDWLFLDAEHGAFTTPDLQVMLQAAGAQTPCLVRVSAPAEVPIKKALDVGATGIIAPLVNSAAQAEQVVRWARYAPQGTRGVGIARAHGYGLQFQEYVDRANEAVAVVVQAEHADAVADIEAIAHVPGVDGVLIGPYDLSASLGQPGQVDHPLVVEAIEQVTLACQAAGTPLGIFGVTAEAVEPYIERGYTLIIAGVDSIMLGRAARLLVERLRTGPAE